MTQAQAVIETIDKLGGIATLNQINQHIFEKKHEGLAPVSRRSMRYDS